MIRKHQFSSSFHNVKRPALEAPGLISTHHPVAAIRADQPGAGGRFGRNLVGPVEQKLQETQASGHAGIRTLYHPAQE
jgi:hypothetical protein